MTPDAVPAAAQEATEHLAAFARRLGVARSTITRAAQAGRLSLTPDGHVRIAASLQRWRDTRGGRDDMAAHHAAARGAQVPQQGQAPQIAPAGPLDAPLHALLRRPLPPATTDPAPNGVDDSADHDTGAATDGSSRAHQQALKLHWRNALLQLELHRATGARLDRAAAIAEAQALGGVLRGAVERLIDQTAPRLAAASSPADRRRILGQQLAGVRRELRREFPAALRRLKPTDTGGDP